MRRSTEMPPEKHHRVRTSLWLWPLALICAAGVLVLFPFDWLEQVWPAYARLFDQVFATPQSHMLGHATIFCVAALLLLAAIPPLRARPLRYLSLMLLAAIAEEAIQSLAKRDLPTLGDGRDLLLDLTGFIAAYLIMRLYLRLRSLATPNS